MKRVRSPRGAGRLSLPLLLLVVASCGDSPVAPPDPGPARVLEVASSGWGSPVVGSAVAVRVRVTEEGRAVEGAEVRWELTGDAGAIEPESSLTGPDGLAEAVWQVGTRVGDRALAVLTSDADPLLLSAVAVAGPAASLRLSPDTLVLTAYRERATLEARFQDPYGNETAAPASLQWSLLDPGAVSLDPAGTLTALSPGATRVRAASGGLEATALVSFAPRGAITVTFDDGFRSAYTRAYPILEGLGLRANVAVYTQPVDESWEAYVTLAQLQELHGAGWAMVSHTVTHPNLTTLSDAELEEELVAGREWIETHGFRGSGVFVVPFHSWGERERAAVARHYEMARGTSAIEFHPDTLVTWIPDDPYALTAYEAEFAPMDTEEGRALVRDFLQRTVEEGRFLELFFHRVEEEMLEGFTRTMELVAEFAEDVITYDEVLERFANSLQDLEAPAATVAAARTP